MRYKLNLMACLFSAVVAGAGISSCKKGEAQEGAKEETEDIPVVKVETVYETDVIQKGEYTASVDADLINNISSSTPNRIRQIYVDKGMTVTKGQKLVELDDINITAYENQIANARAGVENARAGVENARSAVASAQTGVDNAAAGVNNAQANFNNVQLNYNRAVQLYNIGGGTKQNVDAMETQLITARNTLSTAKSSLASSKKGLEAANSNLSSAQTGLASAQSTLAQAERALENAKENTILVSPISGVVTARNYDPGDMTGALPILTVAKVQPVKVVANISEKEFSNVKVGMIADCTFDTYGDTQFEGTISMVSPTIDVQNRTFGIEVTLPNLDNRVLPGMFGRVFLNLSTAKHIVVPDQAVLKQPGSGNQFVYVYKDGKVTYKQVELGQRVGASYEILSGLENGDQVVVSGQSKLTNGKEVKLAK